MKPKTVHYRKNRSSQVRDDIIIPGFITIVIVGLAFGAYWFQKTQNVPVSPPVNMDRDPTQIQKILSDSSITPTIQDIQKNADTLSKSQSTITKEDRNSILNQLNK